LKMADELASVDQQVTAETIEQLFGSDGEDDGKLREGNYTKVDFHCLFYGDMRSPY